MRSSRVQKIAWTRVDLPVAFLLSSNDDIEETGVINMKKLIVRLAVIGGTAAGLTLVAAGTAFAGRTWA